MFFLFYWVFVFFFQNKLNLGGSGEGEDLECHEYDQNIFKFVNSFKTEKYNKMHKRIVIKYLLLSVSICSFV